jgi:hypothetical protein
VGDRQRSCRAGTEVMGLAVVGAGGFPRARSGVSTAMLAHAGQLVEQQQSPACAPAAGEVVAIAVGLALLHGPLHAPQAAVAWIALVVGAHFIGLAVVWKQSFFHWLNASILLCGAIGLVLAVATSPQAAIDTVAGVLPGALLLAFSLWSSIRGADYDAARTTTS